MPSTERPRVFLSYSSDDRPVIEWVAAQVSAMGIEPYLAEQHHQPGARLATKIRAAISDSDALLVLLTEAGAASTYVQQEIGAACQAGKPVVALVDRTVDTTSLAMLDGVEHIPFSSEDPATGAAPLVEGLRALAERRGVEAGTEVVGGTQPVFQLQVSAELQLTGKQLLIGLLIVAAAVGVIYLVVQASQQS